MTPDALAVDLEHVAAVIADLAGVNAQVANELVSAVHPPIRTGALASTVATVINDDSVDLIAGGSMAPYGPIVHARNPFLTRALNEREEAVVGLYVNHLKGATT